MDYGQDAEGRPTYNDAQLARLAADYMRGHPERTWEDCLARARNNFKECGVMPGEDVKP